MHNDFTIRKSLCIAHESIASLNEVRLLLNMPLLQWDKEGKQFRQKKTCMRSLATMATRRWSTAGSPEPFVEMAAASTTARAWAFTTTRTATTP